MTDPDMEDFISAAEDDRGDQMTTDQDTRARLIEAIECSDIELRITQIADVLLPVVERIARERVAAELRATADWFVLDDDDELGPSYHSPDGHPYYEAEFWAAGHLRARADTLDPS